LKYYFNVNGGISDFPSGCSSSYAATKEGKRGRLKPGACAIPPVHRKPPMFICLVYSIYAPFMLTGSF